MFEELCELKKRYNPDPSKVIETEWRTFLNTGSNRDTVRIDLYEKTMGGVFIYEGKMDQTTTKDVYQLRMYWDGLIYDGITPTMGILVACEHPQSVYEMTERINTMKDYNGNHYMFACKTWEDLGIHYKWRR